MAVLIEGISVVIRAEVLLKKFPDGWDGFKKIVPNESLCADNEVVRVGFMTPQDVESFVKKLERNGLVFLKDGQAVDLAVVDQIRGPTSRCDWLEFGHVDIGENEPKVAVCRLTGSKITEMVTPAEWEYEKSISSSFGFVPSEHADKWLKFLRHENGIDVYFNPLTGSEVYVGRTGET